MKNTPLAACATILTAAIFATPVQAYKINSTEDVIDGTGLCLVVQTAVGQLFSYPTTNNPLNSPTQAQFELDGGTLGAAAISYQQLNVTNSNAVTHLYWTIGPADPNCYGYPQILNLRYTP